MAGLVPVLVGVVLVPPNDEPEERDHQLAADTFPAFQRALQVALLAEGTALEAVATAASAQASGHVLRQLNALSLRLRQLDTRLDGLLSYGSGLLILVKAELAETLAELDKLIG